MFKELINLILGKTANDVPFLSKRKRTEKIIETLEKAYLLSIIPKNIEARDDGLSFFERSANITKNLKVYWEPSFSFGILSIFVQTSQGTLDVTGQDGPWDDIIKNYTEILEPKIEEETAGLKSLEQNKKELAIAELDNTMLI